MSVWHRCFLFNAVGYSWLLSSFLMFRLFWFSQWDLIWDGFCVLLPRSHPSLSTFLLKTHLAQSWNQPLLQGASPSMIGANSSFWVSGPRFPSGYPPYFTQALIVPARQTSSFLDGYLTPDHLISRMPSDSAPALTLCVRHRSHLGFVPHCGPPQLGAPRCGYLLCCVLPNGFRTQLLRKERSWSLSQNGK